MVAEHTLSDATEVVVGIETDRGLWVGALIAATAYLVYAINPRAVSRYRDRFTAWAELNQTRGGQGAVAGSGTHRPHNHRAVAGDSPESEGIKPVARTHQNLIGGHRTRRTNQVRNALREYYPAALETVR